MRRLGEGTITAEGGMEKGMKTRARGRAFGLGNEWSLVRKSLGEPFLWEVYEVQSDKIYCNLK